MLNKKIEEITKADLMALIQNEERESQALEYKQEITPNDHGKTELLKDLTAFSNSLGGFLIFGIKEEDGLPKELIGINKNISNQKVDEWITNIVTSGVDPKINFQIKTIKIDSEKVVVLIHIPESVRKPHMVTSQGKFTFYVRHNNTVLNATTREVDNMFQFSKRANDEVEAFLNKRGLLNEAESGFGLNHHSKKLKFHRSDPNNSPFTVFSSIPLHLDPERVDTISQEFTNWLNENTSGYLPNERARLIYNITEKNIDLNGVVYPEPVPSREDNDPENYRHYLYADNNGSFEFGMSDVFYNHQGNRILHMGRLVGLFWIFLSFVGKAYEMINYEGEIYLQTSFANVDNLVLGGFEGSGWAEPYSWNYENPCKPSSNNFKINLRVKKEDLLSPDSIETIVKEFSLKVSRAFGLDNARCFNGEGNYCGSGSLSNY